MKKILQLTKAIILTLAAVIMLLNTNVLTAQAGTIMFPGMIKAEDGRIIVTNGTDSSLSDNTGRAWAINGGYPYCVYEEAYEYEFRGQMHTGYRTYLDRYLTDIIRTDDESKWPSFVVKGSDGIPFYYNRFGQYSDSSVYSKFCYDEKSGWWLEDKAYNGPNVSSNTLEEVTEETKTAIKNGETINGTPEEPVPAPSWVADKAVDSDDVPVGTEVGKEPTNPTEPEEPDNPPKEDEEIKDPYADVNTLGATVTIKTDCIKVKTNKKGVVAQKPLPKSVKVGKKALKKNKTFTVSYEKYTDGWKTVDAVTDEGIYRLVITGKNGYDGVYKKRLYVTADKTIKAMSSVSVKVNKMSYTGNPITSGVIKTAKIGKRTLVADEDYTVTYKNNTDSGIGQVILTAKEGSGLLGTKTVNFTITGNKMSKVKVTGISSITYNPNETMELNMSNVKLAYNGTPLAKDTDFTVSYLNNTKAGTAKIVFTGKGLYNGTLTKKFKITKAALNDSMLDETSKNIEVTYTGKALKPDVILKNGNTPLKKGTDYTLAYKNNKKVSTAAAPAQITVKGKGSYTGSFKVNFAVIAKSNGTDEKSNAKNIKPDEEDDNLKEDEAVVDEPTTEEPVTDEPTEEEPVTDEPTEEEPVTDEPTGDEPVTDEPTGEEPVTDEPTGEEPVTDGPTEEEPVTDEPTGEEPVTDEPTGEEPVTDEPTGEEPVTDEPTEEEPVVDELTEEDPATDKPTEEESATDESAIDAPAAEEYIIFDIDAETVSTVETTAQ